MLLSRRKPCIPRLSQWLVGGGAVLVAATFAAVVACLTRAFKPQRAQAHTASGCPLPPVVHRTIPDHDPDLRPGRLILIGDIHGCCAQFKELLAAVEYQPGHDTLVLAGDLVNKGPASVEVLRHVAAVGALAVRGNHDDAALGAWLQLQRKGTVSEKYHWVRDMGAAEAALLQGLPFTITLPGYGITVVHAGLVPGVGLEEQRLYDMYTMRNLAAAAPQQEEEQQQQRSGESDTGRAEGAAVAAAAAGAAEGRSLAEVARGGAGGPAGIPFAANGPSPNRPWRALEKATEGEAWAGLWPGPGHVFFGHDAKRGLQLMPYATGLDTGCVYGGALTACVVPPLRELRAADAAFVRKAQEGQPLTLKDLQGRLVRVGGAACSPTGGGTAKGGDGGSSGRARAAATVPSPPAHEAAGAAGAAAE